MSITRPFSALLATLALNCLVVAGCSSERAPRSVIQVVEVNQNLPLESDVLKTIGGAGTVVEDAVPVRIKSTPADSILTLRPGGPYGYVVLDHYDIRFESSEDIQPVSGALGWTIHTGETITGSLVVVPAGLKTLPPLIGLDQGGEIQAVAHVTIQGHEANSGAAIQVRCTLQVDFANWVDS